ncbi:hypothetical protein T552_03466 [Pneumocystis carinii B80]|uniref:Derlin n=1 Tax=Pneumocystis carinii (strain B80) TaxID=1408658 RepID=A0A0W4ZB22_PNEC8|nr:hypothetical protein T552_03466 [Pneumocystis carinii B80]KTW25606.1 hypothetical protein T552_03466 [Pneumocystis carinii B80]
MLWPLETWYMDVPIVTRLFITGAIATSVAVQCNWVTPFQLFFSWHSVIIRKQYWRLITTFLYFGNLSFDFLFHIFFIARYCRMLEETSFRGRSREFAYLLLYATTSLLILSPLVSLTFLASPLSFCLIYLWSRRNPSVRLSFLGLFVFNAPYLPWILLWFSFILHNTIPKGDLLGMFVGHVYYYLKDVAPTISS